MRDLIILLVGIVKLGRQLFGSSVRSSGSTRTFPCGLQPHSGRWCLELRHRKIAVAKLLQRLDTEMLEPNRTQGLGRRVRCCTCCQSYSARRRGPDPLWTRRTGFLGTL